MHPRFFGSRFIRSKSTVVYFKSTFSLSTHWWSEAVKFLLENVDSIFRGQVPLRVLLLLCFWIHGFCIVDEINFTTLESFGRMKLEISNLQRLEHCLWCLHVVKTQETRDTRPEEKFFKNVYMQLRVCTTWVVEFHWPLTVWASNTCNMIFSAIITGS